MSIITKSYSGYTTVDISEFNNTDLLNSLNERNLTNDEQIILNEIYYKYSPKELLLSNYSDFYTFIDDVLIKKQVGIIDKNVEITKETVINGDITLRALNDISVTISASVINGFYLKEGVHKFYNIKTRHLNEYGTHYITDRTANILWTNYFEDVQMIGGSYGYDSARGGTATHMDITTMKNTFIDVSGICISVFSQDGPYKALHLENATFKSVISHNIYVHPSVSLHYVNVKTLGAGKLMQHQYSGSGNGGYNTGLYSYFERVDVTLPNTGKPYDTYAAFEMTTLANDNPVIIKDSKIGPYVTSGVKPAIVDAVNTQFVNAGNGIFLRGKVTNCTGGVWSSVSNMITIENSNLSEISYRSGGSLIVKNTTINNIWGADRGASFEMTFIDSKIGTIYDGGNGNGYIFLKNTPTPNLTPSTFRKEMIKII